MKIKEAMAGVKVLTEAHRAIISAKMDYLLMFIEDAPKSGKWKNRAKIGTSKPWYQDVSDWA